MTRAWLVRVVTGLSLDELRSARVRRERYVGPWLPEPVLSGPTAAEDPLEAVERRELLSLCALVVLERLSAAERAVLVLREAFELSHAEIARAVGVSEVASRQLLARARRRLAGAAARTTPSPAAHERLVRALIADVTRRAGEHALSKQRGAGPPEPGIPGDVRPARRPTIALLTDGGGGPLAWAPSPAAAPLRGHSPAAKSRSVGASGVARVECGPG